MKFKCSTEIFANAVATVSKASGVGIVTNAAAGVYISTHEDKVKLACNNYEISIENEIAATIKESGATVINAKLLCDMTRRLVGDELSFESTAEQKVKISAGKTHFDITGIDPVDFPDLPEVTAEQTIVIDSKKLSALIRGTAFAASTSEARLVLTGNLLEIEADTVRMVGLDGYRMAMREYTASGKKGNKKADSKDDKKSIIVPAKAWLEWTKVSPNEGDEDGEVTIKVSHKNVSIEKESSNGNLRFFARVLSGEYMDYNKTIPLEITNEMVVESSALVRAIERVTTVIVNDSMRAPLRIFMDSEGLHFSCETTVGKVDDFIPVEITGKELEIGFNHKFLLDAVKATEEKEIKLQFNLPTSPCLITPADEEKRDENDTLFKYVVLPVRL